MSFLQRAEDFRPVKGMHYYIIANEPTGKILEDLETADSYMYLVTRLQTILFRSCTLITPVAWTLPKELEPCRLDKLRCKPAFARMRFSLDMGHSLKG
jgi:hypothetical protein